MVFKLLQLHRTIRSLFSEVSFSFLSIKPFASWFISENALDTYKLSKLVLLFYECLGRFLKQLE